MAAEIIGCGAGCFVLGGVGAWVLTKNPASSGTPKFAKKKSEMISKSSVRKVAREKPKPGPSIDPTASITEAEADLTVAPGVPKELERGPFVELLGKLIGEAKYLQNNPKLGVTPQEKRAAVIVLEELAPYSTENGGPLVIEELEFVPGRSNLKVVYPGTTSETVCFTGSHFDVVPADPEVWTQDPFKLTEDGDRLFGRGTTDCLGHVAILTRFLANLAAARPQLKKTVIVVFIAAEEGGETGVGIDVLAERGHLEEIKRGPVLWVDTADCQPCCGTAGMMSWQVKCSGRLMHSGFPHKGINSIELANEVVADIQRRFYEDFPTRPEEAAYQFATGSHMKPTVIECTKGSLNQICPGTTVSGDIRLSPFYDVEDVMARVAMYVKDINDNLQYLPHAGPYSRYELPDSVQTNDSELRRGTVELTWLGDLNTFKTYAGVAVSLDSPGHKALVQAFRETNGSVAPFSINGSLPLVKMMQKQGFDVQLCGFGVLSVYHGVNEYISFEKCSKAHEMCLRFLCLLEKA